LKNKGLVVICENEDEKRKIREAMNKNMANCKISEPQKKLPRIKLLNVELEDDENDGEKIIIELKRRNKFFENFSVFQQFNHVVSIQKKFNGKKVANKYNIIFSVDPTSYKLLMELGHLKVGFQRYRVVDGTHIPRCYRCFGFFHRAMECPYKDEICIGCGNTSHKTADCKNDKKYNNCMEFKKKNKNSSIDVNHSITDVNYPCYQKVFKKFSQSISA
jgi:hypothetical protein